MCLMCPMSMACSGPVAQWPTATWKKNIYRIIIIFWQKAPPRHLPQNAIFVSFERILGIKYIRIQSLTVIQNMKKIKPHSRNLNEFGLAHYHLSVNGQ